MTDTTRGIIELSKLNANERAYVYGRLKEKGASDRTIRDIDALADFVERLSSYKK